MHGKKGIKTRGLFRVKEMFLLIQLVENCPFLTKHLGKCLHVIERDLLVVYQVNSHKIPPALCI